MSHKIIDGRALARKTREKVAVRVGEFVGQGHRPPCLAVILVGDDPASEIYVSSKIKACASVGMTSQHFKRPRNSSEADILSLIDSLNNNDEVDGILLQLPLPPQIDKFKCVSAIDPEKDVDGITPVNEGRLVWRYPGLYPCTPLGILELIKSVEPKPSGKVAAIVGRSALVGMPTGTLLENAGCTIIGLHSESIDCHTWTSRADILVVAAGVKHLVGQDWVKPGAIVIDVGIHRDGNRLTGDVDFEAVRDIAAYITPVPGGVGPMTIAMLIKNSVTAYEMRLKV